MSFVRRRVGDTRALLRKATAWSGWLVKVEMREGEGGEYYDYKVVACYVPNRYIPLVFSYWSLGNT